MTPCKTFTSTSLFWWPEREGQLHCLHLQQLLRDQTHVERIQPPYHHSHHNYWLNIQVADINSDLYMSHPARKPTLWTQRNVSTRISLSMPRRLTRIDTFRLLWIFCFRNHYSITSIPRDGMCWSGLAYVDCADWYELIHYAEAIMLVFSRDGSYQFVRICSVIIKV